MSHIACTHTCLHQIENEVHVLLVVVCELETDNEGRVEGGQQIALDNDALHRVLCVLCVCVFVCNLREEMRGTWDQTRVFAIEIKRYREVEILINMEMRFVLRDNQRISTAGRRKNELTTSQRQKISRKRNQHVCLPVPSPAACECTLPHTPCRCPACDTRSLRQTHRVPAHATCRSCRQ